ncbi:hydroxyacid dehydrogenase [Hamadaea tsunoensis]|uniref:hydroxyacid dehydrogenase n=1 Tax=Hamadaea tsunoensis TaxID=53368 RepID=UPI000685413A|nr:hydroxyacid dehydrogenase [Hamadaea tsunoensis]
MSERTRQILFTERLLAELADAGEVDPARIVTDFADPALADALASVEVLLTGWGCPPIDEAALARMPALRAVVHAAGTVKGHVTDAVFARGIVVTSVAEANAVPVAEYALAAILFAGKRVLETAQEFRRARGSVDVSAAFPAMGNYERVVGLVGASRVGRRVAELLRHFEVRVLLHDPYVEPDDARALGAELVELDDLIAASDIVSIHAPQLPATYHMFDRRRLALMRDGATLINTARGSLVDTDALTEQLLTGRLYAILDVTDPEPPAPESPLWDLPNVLLTPHVAGSLGNELGRMVRAALDELRRYASGEAFQHGIEPDELAVTA